MNELIVLLKDTHPIDINHPHSPWKYNIESCFINDYSYNHAQCLFEFAFTITKHNSNNKISIDPNNFDIKHKLDTTYLSVPINVCWLFYSSKLDIMVISFTGTYNETLALIDSEYLQCDPNVLNNYKQGMKVHCGFYKLYSYIRDDLIKLVSKYHNNKTQILISGYSLGGATSTLCCLDLYDKNIRHYTFGSPRVFNTVGADHFNSLNISSYRCFNISDIVTTVPMPVMGMFEACDYKHIGKCITFDHNLQTNYKNHVDVYIDHYKYN